ncbi:MAG TPA: hypothetical protein VFC33_09240 [Acidimicrobiia bacterium]|nr:hypothetical protein [Acidimicrobiia bacterium]
MTTRDARANGRANGRKPAPPAAPVREWVTFDDPNEEGRRWQVDVTFMLSRWRCLFGCGCQGVLTEPTPELVLGCCSYGAHFSDKKDRDRTVRLAKKLSPDEWQFHDTGRRRGVVATLGPSSWRTRLVEDACIFLNRVGFPAGPGCAFHLHAMRAGEHFADWKPEVCWQLPLRRIDREEDDGTVTSVLTEYARDGWGPGGDDFAWWCTEAPEAFTATDAVYRTQEPELRRMIGDELYEQLAAYLDRRARVLDPAPARHPAQTPVALGPTRGKRAR